MSNRQKNEQILFKEFLATDKKSHKGFSFVYLFFLNYNLLFLPKKTSITYLLLSLLISFTFISFTY